VNKEQIFDTYSKNLNLVTPYTHPGFKSSDVYVCPLCFGIYGREALKTKILTIEHVPPKSVGWKKKVLTCQKCNTKQGGQIDSHLQRTLKTRSFNRLVPGTKIQAKIISNDSIKLHGTIQIGMNAKEFKIEVDPKRSDPENYQKHQTLLESGNLKKTTFSYGKGNLRKTTLSILRAGYLWGFAELGYGFIFNPNFDSLRLQLQNPNQFIYSKHNILYGNFSKDTEGINILAVSDFEAFACVFELRLGDFIENACVLMPGSTKKALDDLENVKRLISEIKPDLRFTLWENTGLLNKDPECIYPFKYWMEKLDDS